MEYDLLFPANVNYFQDGFRRNTYPQRFEEYCRLAAPAFDRMQADDAAAFVAWMETRVKGLFRKRQRLDQAFFLLQYVVPGALAANRGDLAGAIRQAWVSAHPECPFEAADYAQLLSGFRNTILGFRMD